MDSISYADYRPIRNTCSNGPVGTKPATVATVVRTAKIVKRIRKRKKK